MKTLVKYLGSLVATLMEICNELKEIRKILSQTDQEDMAVTARQAALILGCSQSKINDMYRTGKLHKYNIKGKRGFSTNELRTI